MTKNRPKPKIFLTGKILPILFSRGLFNLNNKYNTLRIMSNQPEKNSDRRLILTSSKWQ